MPDDGIYSGPGAYDEVFPYDGPITGTAALRAKATVTDSAIKTCDAALLI